MATKKSAPQKAVKPASKTVKQVAPAKKAAPVTKAVPKKAAAPAKPVAKSTPVKKAAPAKKVVAPVKKAVPAKKVVAPAKKVVAPVKPAAKPAPVKKAAPAKKVAPPKKAAVPTKKIIATPAKPAKKEVPVKKEAAAAKVITPVKKVMAEKPEKKISTKVKPVKKFVAKKPVVPKVPEKEREDRRPVVIKQAKVVTEDLSLKKAAIKPIKDVKVPSMKTKSAVQYNPGYVPLDRRVEEDIPNAPLVKYSDTELNEFREIIGKKLAAAKKELAYLQGMFARKDADGETEEARYMTMEDGTISMEREQLGQMASRQVQYIDHLEKALIRIENKTYGICRVTGKLIDKARLRAVPHATLSLEAKLGLHNPKAD